MNGAAEGAFRRHYGHVYGYFRRRVGDPGRAEELTQDVFAAAASSLPTERPGDPPVLVWLYAVARRRFADEARRRARERRLAGMMLPTRSSSPITPRSPALCAKHWPRCRAGSPRSSCSSSSGGLTFAEIGVEVGLTEAAARMRFVRALEQLRADLSERGIEP